MKLQKIRAGVTRVVDAVNYAAMIPLLLMVVVVAVDVVLRKAQLGRIDGSNELTMYFMVWICMLGIPVLQAKNGHVWVNLFVNKFPYRFRCFWRAAVMAVETAIIAVLAVGAYQKVMLFFEKSTVTDVLNMPKWVFAAAGLVAFVEYFALSLIDTIQFCADGAANSEQPPEEESWSDDQVKGI